MIFTSQFQINTLEIERSKIPKEEIDLHYSYRAGADLGRTICEHYPYELKEQKTTQFHDTDCLYENSFLVVRREEWTKFKQSLFEQVVLTKSAREAIMDLIEKIETT